MKDARHPLYLIILLVVLCASLIMTTGNTSAEMMSDDSEVYQTPEPTIPVWTPPVKDTTKRVSKSNTGFSDVEIGAWYEESILLVQEYDSNIVSGYQDGTFRPNNTVRRGEFLKMVMTAANGSTKNHSKDYIHWAAVYYTIAQENHILVPDPFNGNQEIFPCTSEALDEKISRYEMAVIVSNTCAYMLREQSVLTTKAPGRIRDYAAIDAYTTSATNDKTGQFTWAVEQAYGKGILLGYEDKSFHGEAFLRRSEAVTVISRMIMEGKRTMPEWASVVDYTIRRTDGGVGRPEGFKSFAEWLQDGHLDAYGNPDAEARAKLFGEDTAAYHRGYFISAEEAAPYMQAIVVPIWEIDANGIKHESKAWLSVNKVVAEEVTLIFQQIFDDPEQFPIFQRGVGCARFSDTMRHSWGCAIDINPYDNCECNFHRGTKQTLTCGYGWWPSNLVNKEWIGRKLSDYTGRLTGPSVYSISPYGSVVKAFSDYGWGWGGSGSNVVGEGNGWSNGKAFDFMHFSVLRSGG